MKKTAFIALFILLLDGAALGQDWALQRPHLSTPLARAELALIESALANTHASLAMAKVKSTLDASARQGIELEVKNLQATAAIERKSPHDERISVQLSNATGALSGLKSSRDLAVESNAALVEAREAAARLANIAKSAVSAGAAKEELDRPGSSKQAIAREAEKTFLATRAERTSAQSKAREIEEQLNRARDVRQRLVAEALSSGNMSKAREADISAADVSKLAAEAAVAHVQAMQLASREVQLAQVMAETYAELGRDSVGWIKMLRPRR